MTPQWISKALSFDRSSAGYRLRAEILTQMADDARDWKWANALRARAVEWRRLAITADWQEVLGGSSDPGGGR